MNASGCNDYRNTRVCPILKDTASKKEALAARIVAEHPDAQIIYSMVSSKQLGWFQLFKGIYNSKCAYCGVSVSFARIELFEIDHYICKSTFPATLAGRIEAGRTSNLIFSCYLCNRSKGGLQIESDCRDLFYPDNNSIAKVFYRDEDYYIRIDANYMENNLVQQFYRKLKFQYQIRRLDYLLLEIDALRKQLLCIGKEKLAGQLLQCMQILMQRRNVTLASEIED